MSGARVSIPNNVRKTIQNIKEITGNHSEDEIYAMLKECSMDPNETTQKLLLQDPFHEVKRKRDRKKENLNKEITEPKWKTGMHGRGNRDGRGSYPSRHISNDAVGGRTSFSAKENGINQGKKNKETSVVASSSSSKLSGPLPQIPTEANKGPTILLGSGTTRGSHATSASKTPSPSPGVGLSDSDPILLPSADSQLLAGTIRREVGSQQTTVDQIHIEGKLNSPGKVAVEVQGIGKNLLLESSRVGPSSHVSVSNSRPSSNYNNRTQLAIGPQKVGPTMEWKPKPTNPILTQDSESIESTKVPVIPVESQSQSQSQSPTLSASTNLDSNVLIKKLEDSHISDNQHVIIPNHLHVPEAEKLGFCFGSFDASFGLNLGSLNGPEPVSDKSSIASEVVDESIEDQQPRNENALSIDHQGDDPDRPTSCNNIPENLSTENADSSNAGPHHQYPVVHTSPNFSFGFMPPMIGTHLNESQYPLVQQPIDPASYYAQFYRAGADADGRVSPFQLTGVPNKFNGNIPILPPQASPSSQEVGNSIMLSGTNPPTTTAQTSIPVTQQPIPVFRQPTGVHLPHYPPNYIPYGPYFSPFYVPQPTIHQFLSNGGTFSQHPQTGYSGPPVANPNPKYPAPQYKPAGHYGSNPGSGTTAANLGSNEDHGGSRFNESNVYITGQQSEGLGVWVGPPGRDISGLQPNSFYNMGQGPFANIYHHPAQPVTTGAVHPLLQQHPQTLGGPGADMAGPTPQVNWPNNY